MDRDPFLPPSCDFFNSLAVASFGHTCSALFPFHNTILNTLAPDAALPLDPVLVPPSFATLFVIPDSPVSAQFSQLYSRLYMAVGGSDEYGYFPCVSMAFLAHTRTL